MIVAGENKSAAYRKAFGDEGAQTVSSRRTAVARLMRDEAVQHEISRLNERADVSAVAQRQEVLEFLTRVLRTPVGEVDERSDLCGEVTYLKDGTSKVKMIGKLDAMKELNRMMGYYEPDKSEVAVSFDDAAREAIRRIKSPVVPNDLMSNG